MARIRTVKPEFWTSEQIMECSPNARLLFIGLWNFCDDAGIHIASPKTLKAEIFPSDDISVSDVERLVDELIVQGLLDEYEVAGRHYWAVTGWHHQRIDQPTYKHPRPDGSVPAGVARRRVERRQAEPMLSVRQPFGEHSENSRRTLDECSPPEWNGKEGSGHGAGNENHIAQPASLPPAPSADCPESGHALNRDCVEPDAGKQAPLLVTPSPAKQGRAINPGAARFKARFDEFWDTFAHKHGKTRAMKAWMAVGAAAGRDADLEALAGEILRAAALEAKRRPALVATGRTPIYPEGWLSQRRFEDEGLLEWTEPLRKGAAPEGRGEFVGGLL